MVAHGQQGAVRAWGHRRSSPKGPLFFVQGTAWPTHPVGVSTPCQGLPTGFHILLHASKCVALQVDNGHLHGGVNFGSIGMDKHMPMCTSHPVLSLPQMIRHESGSCWTGPRHFVTCRRIKGKERGLKHGGPVLGQRTKWRQVFNDVGPSAKGAQDQISFAGLDGHVTHWHSGHLMRPMPPIHPPVHTEIEALFGSKEQQIRNLGILHHAQSMCRDVLAVHQTLPRLAAVTGPVQVGRPIVAAVIVGHNIDFVWIVGAHMNLWDP